MHIREIDVKVSFYCEEDWEIYLLIDKMKELYKYREDLLVEHIDWFEDSQGDIYCVILEHTDGADILQLKLRKEILIN